MDYDGQAIVLGSERVLFELPCLIYTVDTVNEVTLPPMTIALVECQVGSWQPGKLPMDDSVLVSTVNPTMLFDPTSGLATAQGLTTVWKTEDSMRMWAHVSNPTKAMASL